MLRGESCLADYLPAEGSAPFGLFAARVTGAEGDGLVAHAARVTLAEAASEHLRRQFEAKLPEGQKLIMPGIGYPCCPDHSLKRDVLAALPAELEIVLTDSCSMIPEASVCGLVIAHSEASYRDIRHITRKEYDDYAARRGFTEAEAKLFLSHLL